MFHVDVGSSNRDHLNPEYQLLASKGQPLIFNCTAPALHDSDNVYGRRFTEYSSNEFLSRHQSCFQNGHTYLETHMALLLVNTQIYFEARCIPYASNTFAFLSRSSLMSFATRILRPFQAQSLRHIILWVPLNEVRQQSLGIKTWGAPLGLSPLAMQRLSGLLTLDVKISIFHGYLRWITNLGAPDAWKDGEGIAGLMDLKALPLRTVKVSVAEEEGGDCYCCVRPGKVLQEGDVRHYAEGVRRQILGVS